VIRKGNRSLGDEFFETLRVKGYAVIEDVYDEAFLARTRAALRRAYDGVVRDIGVDRLTRAGELGVIRNMFVYEDLFFAFLQTPELVQIVDRVVGETAILHLQNGFILPSLPADSTPQVFQNAFHRDFPRYLNGYVASINVMVAVDAFEPSNGATLVVPGSHQKPAGPEPAEQKRAVPATCPAGSLLVFDSTLWHAAGFNTSGTDRLAINHQFTKSWIKQQIDYVRAIGPEVVTAQPARVQRMLGMYTRVVTSLDEYYQPEERRLYRRGQG
jgi:ectoine hydroxylase-related dioxygenase (phytanoyl-CoA dioxygenase family)